MSHFYTFLVLDLLQFEFTEEISWISSETDTRINLLHSFIFLRSKLDYKNTSVLFNL